jgi:hypothetical protein
VFVLVVGGSGLGSPSLTLFALVIVARGLFRARLVCATCRLTGNAIVAKVLVLLSRTMSLFLGFSGGLCFDIDGYVLLVLLLHNE